MASVPVTLIPVNARISVWGRGLHRENGAREAREMRNTVRKKKDLT